MAAAVTTGGDGMRHSGWLRALSGVAVAAATVGFGAAPAADATSVPAPVVAGSRYLALGDSVPFGFRESSNLPTPNYPDATSFVGYPEDVGARLGLKVANASCPGETAASLVEASAPSNGCETNAAGTRPGYRARFPLHVDYPNAQLAYAKSYLRRHPDTRLVSLMIGANDLFRCEENTADECASELPATLAAIGAHVSKILKILRRNARYAGQIVLVDYYSLDYTDPASNAFSQTLNSALNAAGAPYGVELADGYGAFETAAAAAGGDTCAAGLLTTLTTGGCGIHPSVAGQQVLAGAVERVVDNP